MCEQGSRVEVLVGREVEPERSERPRVELGPIEERNPRLLVDDLSLAGGGELVLVRDPGLTSDGGDDVVVALTLLMRS